MSFSLMGYNPTPLLSSSFSIQKYRHIALSISGTTHTLYLDGSAVAVNYNSGDIFSIYNSEIQDLYIGCAGDLSYGFTGIIDDFKVWNRALPDADIKSIFNSTMNLPFNKLSTEAQYKIFSPNTINSEAACAFAVKLVNRMYSGPIMSISGNTSIVDVYQNSNNSLITSNGIDLSTWLNGSTPYVVTWYDQTGNGNHASQNNPLLRPSYNSTMGGYMDFKIYSYFNLNDNSLPYGTSNISFVTKLQNHTTPIVNGAYPIVFQGSGSTYTSFSYTYNQGSGNIANKIFLLDQNNNGYLYTDTNTIASNVPLTLTIKASTTTTGTYNIYRNNATLTLTPNYITNYKSRTGSPSYLGGAPPYGLLAGLSYFYAIPMVLSTSDRNILENT
jgi:hypothetical protein